MEEQFVPYELALKLEELGFDEYCFGEYFTIKGSDKVAFETEGEESCSCIMREYDSIIKAPLWQQAFEWFRINHLLIAEINVDRVPLVFRYRIFSVDNTWEGYQEVGDKGYKKARQACLEKLIEIVEKL